jgi:REP-associated tyrosine transposase
MSCARRIVPGMTVTITRRVLRRTMLLRPDPELHNLFLYCLAVLAHRYGIAVHHFVLMSNHYHLTVTDTHGQLPNFLRDFNRILALGIKVLRKWEGAVWDHEKASVVELRTEHAVIEQIAYGAANPVAALAVRHAHQWPGLNVLPEQLGRTSFTARRPDFYFDQDNPQWPAVATLQLTMPELSISDALARDAVAQELERLEIDAHRAAVDRGARFLGPSEVLAVSPYDRAKSWEPLRSRNPTFAVGRGQREAFFDAVRVLREFRKAYLAALASWRDGIRDVLFPLGTWLMQCQHRALVAPS